MFLKCRLYFYKSVLSLILFPFLSYSFNCSVDSLAIYFNKLKTSCFSSHVFGDFFSPFFTKNISGYLKKKLNGIIDFYL